MTKAKLFYLLSETGRKDSLLKGGDGKEFQTIETESTPEILQMATVNENGEIWLPVGCKINYKGEVESKSVEIAYQVDKGWYAPKIIAKNSCNNSFETVQTVEQLVQWEKTRLEKLEASLQLAEEELKIAMAEYEKKESEKEARRKAREEISAKSRVAREAEKEAREKERREWILAHGSQYLKDCLEMDVKANLEYVVERAAQEFPGYTVDYAETARWDERFSPSKEALSELKKMRTSGAEAEIVWITAPAKVRECDYEDELEPYKPCEAVVIKNYLGKYDLVKII